MIPKTIIVGPFTYTVSTDRGELLEACRSERSDLLGHCAHRELAIAIDTGQAPGQLRDTMLHECIHAMFNMVGLTDEWGAEKEEAVVARLSPALLQLVRDNPKLLTFLAEP